MADRGTEEQRNGAFSVFFVFSVFLMFLMFFVFSIINLVIPRRGICDDKGCTHALCPDVGIYRCVSSLRVVMLRVVGCNVASRWYQYGGITMVD